MAKEKRVTMGLVWMRLPGKSQCEAVSVEVKWHGVNLHVRRNKGMWSVTHVRSGMEVVCTSQPWVEVLRAVKELDTMSDLWAFGSMGKSGTREELQRVANVVLKSGLLRRW